MISKERYEMLKDAIKKGADLSPADYKTIRQYEGGKMKFRKKPVVIEAMQFNELKDYLKIQRWMKDSGSTIADEVRFETPIMLIPTLEGTHAANPGDWIIKGIKGEFYPCKPDIFQQTYEAAE